MKYYTISGANDNVIVVFRVNDKGLPEEWIKDTKTWVYKAYLWELISYNCHYSTEITAAQAADLII